MNKFVFKNSRIYIQNSWLIKEWYLNRSEKYVHKWIYSVTGKKQVKQQQFSI